MPWLNVKIKKLIKKRNNLFKRFKKNNQSYSKMKYIIARNDVTKKIRQEKKMYEMSIIKRSRNNRKVFYKYVANLNSKNSFNLLLRFFRRVCFYVVCRITEISLIKLL